MLDQLRGIYEQRQHLNQITMSIMLPRQPRMVADDGKYHNSTDGKMKCIEEWGGGCMLSQSAELVTALRDLRSNLSAERKLLVQLHTLLVQKARLLPPACRTFLLPFLRSCFHPCHVR